MTLFELNDLPKEQVRTVLLECCGSVEWADRMVSQRPHGGEEQFLHDAEIAWQELSEQEWLAAFSKHPRIGETGALSARSREEQAGMHRASISDAEAMRALNREYLEKFGWKFIVCATGKSAREMRAAIENRMSNTPSDEIRIAAAEQAKIMQIRLRKLLEA